MPDIVQINISMESATAMQLDQMAFEAGYDNRSAFVRWLIRQEVARRNGDARAGALDKTADEPKAEQS